MGRQRGPQVGSGPAEKTCASCGRRIEWRKAWARNWDDVRWCSDSCRRRGVSPTDHELEATLLRLLEGRARSATVCPSEAARAVAGEPDGEERGHEAWRELMEPARRAARRLVASGDVVITQQGTVVDPSTAVGPIRVRRA
ncbi:MAG: DUF2256 and DUF3253 domain-containing protein [Actinomycetota bacterium]|nr:DUF2256 and DUF3253 domain-containing protein [Actinomycetota bacterium]